METVNFTAMRDGTREEFELIRRSELEHASHVASRLLLDLQRLESETIAGYKVTRLHHALQCATMAMRDGADSDWIVSALLHDIGDTLAPMNHDRFAAEILRPYVRDECAWTVEHHATFQLYYYAHHLGWDRHARDAYRDDPRFDTCAAFCERWDQGAFDPAYAVEPLQAFAPMVHEVFARKPWDESVLRRGQVLGLPTRPTTSTFRAQ